jgi:hypothetical protein
MIPIDIDKEHHVCMMYRSTRVYDYNTAIDWLILIARPLSTITLRDRSSEELLRILWLNGRKEKRKKSNRKVEFTINL